MTFRVTAKLPRLRALHPGDAELVFRRVLYQTGQEIAGDAAEDHAPVNTGALRSSIGATEPEVEGGKITVLVYAGGPAASYALYVHEGTRPHKPPLGPLIAWVREKGLARKAVRAQARAKKLAGIKPVRMSRAARKVQTMEEEAKAEIAIARGIQAKIAQVGTRPTKFLEIPFLVHKEHVPRKLRQAIRMEQRRALAGQ